MYVCIVFDGGSDASDAAELQMFVRGVKKFDVVTELLSAETLCKTVLNKNHVTSTVIERVNFIRTRSLNRKQFVPLLPPFTQYVFMAWRLVKHRNNFTSPARFEC
jgi:hypothetical protein